MQGIAGLNFHASLQELLAAARQRAFHHVFVRELLLALAVGFGVAALILLAGSGNIAWIWVPIAAAATLLVRLILENRKRPSEYAIAQEVDDRLKLADTLSTAAYFAAPQKNPSVDPAVRDLQRARAEEAARSVDLKQALPMRRPVTLVPAAIMALMVSGVFLVRFTATGSFDTRTSLVEGPLKALLQPTEKQAHAEKKPGEGVEPGNGEDTNKDFDKNRDYAGEPEAQQEETAENPETPDAQKGDQQKSDGKGETVSKESQDQQQQNSQNMQDSEQQTSQDGQQQESLMDKLKDAMSDLMNKVKPSSNKQNGKNGKKGDKQPGEKQDQSADNDDKNPGDNADSENHNRGNEMDSSGVSAEGQKDDNEHSGVGSEEGDKSARQAEALKAMGKISELFGKRAENVQGAVMIEVGSTRQQLKTPLSQRNAAHVEAGSEIHRDEVPLEYQQFVQQYFDQVRRNSPAPSK